jgi:protein-disulfide isomerase
VSKLRHLPLLLLVATLASLGCRAQVPPPAGPYPTPVVGKPLPPALSHRVEVMLRQKANLPPGSVVNVGPATTSEFPSYSTVAVTITSEGRTSHPIPFLLSNDGKTLAQLSKYDISPDPRNMLSADGRPSRGGPPTAPVIIVGFDDLECPYCARLHQTIFPAITDRYGDKVRIVYKDFPLTEIHPWAMHAAVDVNCLAAQSQTGYWNLVDHIHAHASDIGADASDPKKDKTLPVATAQLDRLTVEQGKLQKADEPKLEACIAKQDTTAVDASLAIATSLNLGSAPTLFINGNKIDGAVPIEFIFSIIDEALRAENVVPPPPYVPPTPPATPVASPASTPAKPSN